MRGLLWVTVILAALWGGYWWAGARGVEQAATGWIDDQRARGLMVAHDGLTVSGFPNRFDLTVTGLSVADPARDTGWTTPFVQVFAMTWKPWHLIAATPGGQTITLPGQVLTLDGSRIMASLVLTPGTDLALKETVASGEGLALSSTLGWRMTAEKVVASTRADATTANTHRLGLQATGLAPDPQIAAAAGLPAAIDTAHLDARATFSAPIDRNAGQTRPRLTALALDRARLDWGRLKIAATGTLAADAAGFAAGDITLTVEDWPALPRLLVAMGVVTPEAEPTLAAGLKGFAKGDPTRLEVTLTFADGQMRLGLIPLGLAPFWG